jgi:hypothetical protein
LAEHAAAFTAEHGEVVSLATMSRAIATLPADDPGQALSRHLGRREHLETILPPVAGLVSSQEQASRPARCHRPSRAVPAGTAR